jgi:biotin-dependent carboxylase-like uncharacterized protein
VSEKATQGIVVVRAPAYASVQDLGRRGFMANGVPRSGAMDRRALLTLNALLGNDRGAAAVEFALTGGAFEFTSPVAFAVGGGHASLTLDDEPIDRYRTYTASAGNVLVTGSIELGRFLYLAVADGIQTSAVMSSRSTYVPGGFGGLDGRRLKTGDEIPTLASSQAGARRRHYVSDALPAELCPSIERSAIRFIERDQIPALLDAPWIIAGASDRTGYRLSGSNLEDGASIVSEPVCPGTIQLPPSGEPIVLMSDAPTVGGYRIAGVVATADLGVLAQLNPGTRFTFEPMTVREAQRELHAQADILERVRQWSLS